MNIIGLFLLLLFIGMLVYFMVKNRSEDYVYYNPWTFYGAARNCVEGCWCGDRCGEVYRGKCLCDRPIAANTNKVWYHNYGPILDFGGVDYIR